MIASRISFLQFLVNDKCPYINFWGKGIFFRTLNESGLIKDIEIFLFVCCSGVLDSFQPLVYYQSLKSSMKVSFVSQSLPKSLKNSQRLSRNDENILADLPPSSTYIKLFYTSLMDDSKYTLKNSTRIFLTLTQSSTNTWNRAKKKKKILKRELLQIRWRWIGHMKKVKYFPSEKRESSAWLFLNN